MKTSIRLLLLLTVCISCNRSNISDESENVKKVLFDYFDGISNQDLIKLNSVTTKDFILFEDGKVWNNDSLVSILKKMNISDIDYTFDNMKVKVDGTIGNMNYHNTGNVTMNDTTKLVFKWIESASFRKEGGQWKLDFLHSSIRK